LGAGHAKANWCDGMLEDSGVVMKIGGTGKAALLEGLDQGRVAPAYLILGERAVTRPLVASLAETLVPEDVRLCNLEVVEGEQYTEGALLDSLRTRPFFPGRKVVVLRDPPFLLTSAPKKARWNKIAAALKAGDEETAASLTSRLLAEIRVRVRDLADVSELELRRVLDWPEDEPVDDLTALLDRRADEFDARQGNDEAEGAEKILHWLAQGAGADSAVLVVETEFADRRSRCFQELARRGVLVDLAVDERDKKAGLRRARDLVTGWVREAGRGIQPRAVEMLLEQVGQTDLFALRTEIDKLTALVAEGCTITREDVEGSVARRRREEMYQLTEALGAGDLHGCLDALDQLTGQGIHPLALLQTLANFFRRVLLLKAALDHLGGPRSARGIGYQAFQREVLPGMKAYWGSPLPEVFKGAHPYGLFKTTLQAGRFDTAHVLDLLASFAEMDFRLKGGRTEPKLVLEEFIMRAVEGINNG